MSLTDKTREWLQKNADVDLKGKTAVVTGSNSGVGFKTAETLLYLGADVILACRNMERAGKAREALADFSSIDAFVNAIRERNVDIDVFVNNAGVFHQPGKKTRDGLDLVLGTNYFGTYYLTEKLLPYLATLPHQVTYINTISLIHKIGTVDYDDFFCTRKYRSVRVYARSKICLAKYTYYLAAKMSGTNVRVYMNHPGSTITPLGLNAVGPRIARIANKVASCFNSTEKSALSVAYIMAHDFPVGSIIGPDKGLGGWGYPKVNRILRKVKTGAGQLIDFTKTIISHI